MQRLLLGPLFILAAVAVACGGGGSSDDTAPSDPATARVAISAVSTIAPLVARGGAVLAGQRLLPLRSDVAPKAITVELPGDGIRLPCLTSGEMIFDGAVSFDDDTEPPFRFESSTSNTFRTCDGLDGSLEFLVSGVASEQSVSFSARADGELSDYYQDPPCTVEASPIEYNVNISPAEDSSQITVLGRAEAHCGNFRATCSWDGVDILDQESLEAGCGI